MKETTMKFAVACATTLALAFSIDEASAQCSTCAVPQVAYSPVVYNTYSTYNGWYLGKNLARRRSYRYASTNQVAYRYAYPTTYATSYAPAYNYASYYAPTYSYASYAPSCSTCGTSPCCCQTTCRPVIMTPVVDCNSCSTCTSCSYAPTCCNSCTTCGSCGTCDSCSGVIQSSYDTTASSDCPTCNSSAYSNNSSTTTTEEAPSLQGNSTSPPPTFRESDRLDPVPATESSDEAATTELGAPLLLNPNDQITKRPTAPVWTAVYKRPATITEVKATTPKKKVIGWTAGN